MISEHCKTIKNSRRADIRVEYSLSSDCFLVLWLSQGVGMSSPHSVRMRYDVFGVSGTFTQLPCLLLSYCNSGPNW